MGALRSGQPSKFLGGHHVEAADEQMSQLLQLPELDFARLTVCAPLCKSKTLRGSTYGVWGFRSFCHSCTRVTGLHT
jgi:hypothetical protein